MEQEDKKAQTIKVFYRGKEHDVKLKPFISLQETIQLVNDAADLSFLEIDGQSTYFPVMEDFAFKLHFLTHLTNIRMPKDPEAAWKLIYGDDVARQVMENYSSSYCATLSLAVAKQIAHRKQQLLNNERILNIGNVISEALTGIGQIFQDVDYKKILDTMKEEYPEFEKEIEQAKAEEM